MSISTFFDEYLNIKKMVQSKREYREQMARVEALPHEYRYVFKKIQERMWMFGGRGRLRYDENPCRFVGAV